MACTPGDLLNLAKCFNCLEPKQLEAIKSYLLCQINTNPIGGVAFISTATASVAGSATETSAIGAGVGSLVIPANTLVAGTNYRFYCGGTFSEDNSANSTLAFRLKVNGSTVITLTKPTNADQLGGFDIECSLTCRTIGASGTLMPRGYFLTDGTANNNQIIDLASSSTVAVNTTTDLTISATLDWSNNSTWACTLFEMVKNG